MRQIKGLYHNETDQRPIIMRQIKGLYNNEADQRPI